MDVSVQAIPVPSETETFSHERPRQLFKSHLPRQGLPKPRGCLLPPAQAKTSFLGLSRFCCAAKDQSKPLLQPSGAQGWEQQVNGSSVPAGTGGFLATMAQGVSA